MRVLSTVILYVASSLFMLLEGVLCLECYSCTNITDIKLCKTKATCGQGESCYVDNNEGTFNMGCIDNTKCGNRVSLGTGSVVGKRQVARCHECCSADRCNEELCIYSAAIGCEDDPNIDCARIESLFAVCQNSQQAHDLCPKFCGLCKNDLQTTHIPNIVTTGSSCQDSQNNCDRYGDEGCKGIFEAWARAHCARRCGYCDEMTTPGGSKVDHSTVGPGSVVVVSSSTFTRTGVKSPIKGTCFFQNKTFNEGEHWQDTCRYDCQCSNTETNTALCSDVCPHYTALPPSCTIRQKLGECCPKLDCGNATDTNNETASLNVTATGNFSECQDKIIGCEYYEDIVCRGIYEPWARAHCALRCGYCGYTAPCVDKLTYCNAYELQTACRDFPGWARYNCKKSCGLCS